jgi:hypothetical protein
MESIPTVHDVSPCHVMCDEVTMVTLVQKINRVSMDVFMRDFIIRTFCQILFGDKIKGWGREGTDIFARMGSTGNV